MPITAIQLFIEAIEMQECTGKKIQDNIYQSSKNKLFAKDNHNSLTRQSNHTYLESMVAHDQTK